MKITFECTARKPKPSIPYFYLRTESTELCTEVGHLDSTFFKINAYVFKNEKMEERLPTLSPSLCS